MKSWLIFINSYEEFQEINSYLREEERETVYSIMYFVIKGSIKCKEGQVFGQENEISIAISFYTYEKGPITKIVASKIVRDARNIIRLTDLESNEVTPEYDFDAECYIRNGKSFFTENDLYRYLEKNKIKVSKFN